MTNKKKDNIVPKPWCISVLVEDGLRIILYSYTGVRIVCKRSAFISVSRYKKSVLKNRKQREEKFRKLKYKNDKNTTGGRPVHKKKWGRGNGGRKGKPVHSSSSNNRAEEGGR